MTSVSPSTPRVFSPSMTLNFVPFNDMSIQASYIKPKAISKFTFLEMRCETKMQSEGRNGTVKDEGILSINMLMMT